MTAEENVETTKKAYAAFMAGDVEGASAAIDDSIEWTVQGNSTVSGVYHGKEEVLGFWMQLASKGFSTEPSQFLGDGDTVVVLTTVKAGDETLEEADVLTFRDGKLAGFRSIGDTAMLERVWGTR